MKDNIENRFCLYCKACEKPVEITGGQAIVHVMREHESLCHSVEG